MSQRKRIFAGLVLIGLAFPFVSSAQEYFPVDNGLATYHTAPRYRSSEEHPLRILAYVGHPVGWLARELFTRPLSYFAGSTPTTRSVMGFREPYDFRRPECFSADPSAPDCRAITPFNYGVLDDVNGDKLSLLGDPGRQVYFPDVNFDFDVRNLNDLGRGRVRQIAQLLEVEPGVLVVLEGHTDFIGGQEYNEQLGLDRAEAVRAELVALGVSPERLSTVTFGKSRPVFEEEEDWARAINRRVEIHVGGGSE